MFTQPQSEQTESDIHNKQDCDFKISYKYRRLLFAKAGERDKSVAEEHIAHVADGFQYIYDAFEYLSANEKTQKEELFSSCNNMFNIGYAADFIMYLSRES